VVSDHNIKNLEVIYCKYMVTHIAFEFFFTWYSRQDLKLTLCLTFWAFPINSLSRYVTLFYNAIIYSNIITGLGEYEQI
jgi:hypothetical protein